MSAWTCFEFFTFWEEVIGTAAPRWRAPTCVWVFGREGTSQILEDTIPGTFGEVQRFEAWVFSDRVEGWRDSRDDKAIADREAEVWLGCTPE